MTIQPDEELHVIPNAGAPGTAGGGFRVVDRTDATDEEFRAHVAVFDAAEEPEEVTVERVARAIYEADSEMADEWDEEWHPVRRRYRRLATAALTALRGDRAPLAGQHTTDEETGRG